MAGVEKGAEGLKGALPVGEQGGRETVICTVRGKKFIEQVLRRTI